MIKSAYIHVPFCSSKCNYCSFVSYDTLTLKHIYIGSLISEIKTRYKNELMDTIYIGGGTPSILSVNDFSQLLNLFNFNDKTEITVEINPEHTNKDYFKELRSLGINRISVGVQVFDDDSLYLIGRRHTKNEAIQAVKYAQNAGFDNISIDLIYGLPHQTLENYLDSLKQALDLDIQHISLYGLKIEEGCRFYNKKPDFLPDNDEQADMYLQSIEVLSQAGFTHYEISNFAQKGFESRHNLNYWNNNQYYGFGVAASGYEGDLRYTNQSDIEKYIQNHKIRESAVELTKVNKLEEEIFLGLRKIEGINVAEINKKHNINFSEKYQKILDKYILSGHLKETDKGYKLTLNGILLSNNILSEFIEG